MNPLRFAILTISDRSARGERPDLSGPALTQVVQEQGWQVVRADLLPDNQALISERLSTWCDSGEFDIVLTTGGTGFGPRDVTPEATETVVDRDAPGLAEAMRLASLNLTPHAMLSRAKAGIRKSSLIINLPGSPKGAVENLRVVLPVLAHAVQLIQGSPDAETGHHHPASH
jgi:molybdopterin adenylyltransferase